jgi:hypothetical protein
MALSCTSLLRCSYTFCKLFDMRLFLKICSDFVKTLGECENYWRLIFKFFGDLYESLFISSNSYGKFKDFFCKVD